MVEGTRGLISMKKVIIIYESVYGNTEQIAIAIAEGIRHSGDIECKVTKTGGIHTDELADYDAILLGCPNHTQEPARNMTKFIDRAHIVPLEGKIGAAFDTYTGGNKGTAVGILEKIIRERLTGINLVVDGLSCKVDGRKGPLSDGEIELAQEFGKKIGQKLMT
ncbi:MAG: flavodoxin family protein [Candidatus Thorarchaeota archaeon]